MPPATLIAWDKNAAVAPVTLSKPDQKKRVIEQLPHDVCTGKKKEKKNRRSTEVLVKLSEKTELMLRTRCGSVCSCKINFENDLHSAVL